MIKNENTRLAACFGVVGGFFGYAVISSLIKMTCTSPLIFEHTDKIARAGTSVLAAFAIAITIFVFAIVSLNQKTIEKFDKIVVLTLAAYVVFWLLYVFLDNRVCSPDAWRHYIAYLIVPSLLATIALVGKSWLNPHA